MPSVDFINLQSFSLQVPEYESIFVRQCETPNTRSVILLAIEFLDSPLAALLRCNEELT